MTACMPAENTDPCAALIPSVRVTNKIKAAAESIKISMMTDIPKYTCSSPTIKEGRQPGNEPKKTIKPIANKKISTDSRADCTWCTNSSFCLRSLNTPYNTRFLYSGSSSSSTPICIETKAAISIPSKVAGTVIFNISNNVMSKPANSANIATVAAEIGLAVIACCEAITAITNGRSGRIFVSVATSAITGKTE